MSKVNKFKNNNILIKVKNFFKEFGFTRDMPKDSLSESNNIQ